MNTSVETLRAAHLAVFSANGGKEEDFAFACRERRVGEPLALTLDRSVYRAMTADQLEEELEDMQNDLDDTVDAIEEFEDENGHPAFYHGEVLDDHEALLDERFAVEFYIREVMGML